ncbi:unnamed protein product [marine sediment metagenome]|uniref:HTH cro/C1-type domain-containing protein n=1 Tax=marine sediment metagenome TaxID=412755 RepID=X0ZVV6_9ZZZZ
MIKKIFKENGRKDILTLRRKLGCSQEKLASIIGITSTTVSRWENNKSIPSTLANKGIRELEKIIDKMDGVIKKGKEAEWLNTHHGELDDDTPLEVISKGSEGVREVLGLLEGIKQGLPV